MLLFQNIETKGESYLDRKKAAACLLSGLIVACALGTFRQQTVSAQSGPPTPSLQNPDRACASCHAAIYQSYEKTAMAQGSGLAVEQLTPGSYTHAPSGVTYSVSSVNGTATLHSVRESSTAPLDDTERLIYFIGSGVHGRTYLFSRPLPEKQATLWFEAPVNWYTQRASYGMAPAYDNAKLAPLTLPTDAGCLHCHTTSVRQPLSNAINAFKDRPFDQGGIGCSACHGDPAAHLRSGGKVHMTRIGELSPMRRDSVCLQCHLEGDAMVQKAAHTLSTFTAGEDLNDTAVYFVNTSSQKSAMRASSQYEGMLRSACRRAVGDRMTCTTCHDPHSAPSPEQRVAFFRSKCLQCHGDSATFHPDLHHPEQQDCASCHMPSRATSDISHEQNVDHDIEARHPTPSTAGLQLHSMDDSGRFTHAVTLEPVGDFKPTDREVGLAYAQFAVRGDRDSYSKALELLTKVEGEGKADAVVHEQLGFLAQIRRDTRVAQKEYEAALQADPNSNLSLANLGVLEAQQGELPSAIRHLSTAADNDPTQTAVMLNLAAIQCRRGNAPAAKSIVQKALVFNPDSPDARKFLNSGDYAGMHCQLP